VPSLLADKDPALEVPVDDCDLCSSFNDELDPTLLESSSASVLRTFSGLGIGGWCSAFGIGDWGLVLGTLSTFGGLGLVFRVRGTGFAFGSRVSGAVCGFCLRVEGLGLEQGGAHLLGAGSSQFPVSGLGFAIQGLGFKICTSWARGEELPEQAVLELSSDGDASRSSASKPAGPV
jgi:hypothetical protein